MNIIRHRRNITMILGIIFLNIYIRLMLNPLKYDDWSLIFYGLINLTWILLIHVSTKESIKELDKIIENAE